MSPERARPADDVVTALAGSRTIALTWHCLRRRRDDPAFLRSNLEAGLAAGAVVEVDLVATRGGEMVCLHDLTLERETTGRGSVAAQSSEAVLALQQRDNAGRPLDSTVLGLRELVDLLRTRQQPGRPDGRIQLDLKEPLAGITPEVRRRFTAVLDGLGGWFTLSGLDWLAVQRLARAVPGLVTGFDPEDAIENGMPVDQAAAYCLSTARRPPAPSPRRGPRRPYRCAAHG